MPQFNKLESALLFGLRPHRRPREEQEYAVLGDLTKDILGLLWKQTQEELKYARDERRAVVGSVIAIFSSEVLAIAFLTPIIVGTRLWGRPIVPWVFGTGALIFSSYVGTLCGILLIVRRFTDEPHRTALISSTAGAQELELVADARERLRRAQQALNNLQAGFARMVRLTWLALFCWAVLGVCAAIGHK